MTKIDQFKKELGELLSKYNATIDCNISGDTHGISNEMVINIDKVDYKINSEWYIEANDFK